MNIMRSIILTAAVAVGAAGTSPAAFAQAYVDIGVDVGPAPMCPYGYYDYSPYPCAPYGYYGPEWFLNGGFIGVGPWFHGPAHFRGHVDSRFDVRRGYARPLPQRNERPNPAMRLDRIPNFHGNELHAGHGGSAHDQNRH